MAQESSDQAGSIVIRTDGTIETIDIEAVSSDERLQLMYAALGCHTMDLVRLTDGIDMWVDDNGLYTAEVNPIATALAQRYGLTWQSYHGAVLLAAADDEGDTINLTTERANAMRSICQSISEGV
ncbi:Domain of uncharacterised function (DUF3846) [Mycobacteroides abscessus subsp. abscessus]|uniref:DUF3846 domain-containing protein n=1 Tax=Mycobacteroides abscessus TaxID=36809 RepID=UPI0009A7C9D2|nr:DUF3846 domain-containing protein [Mycobacteroides abscessus]SKO33970.1 Domain of uncharacterised function (DUF3846) [Mycobacteroides abscessus subsp. abscessus]